MKFLVLVLVAMTSASQAAVSDTDLSLQISADLISGKHEVTIQNGQVAVSEGYPEWSPASVAIVSIDDQRSRDADLTVDLADGEKLIVPGGLGEAGRPIMYLITRDGSKLPLKLVNTYFNVKK